MATYKDLQRETGLSLSTISKYYNGRTVLEENRLAIEEAATRLGFRINTFARNLRSRRSRTVGVLLPALDNEFHLSIIAGVEQALRADEISVLVCSSRDEPGAAVEFLRSKMVEAIIAVPVPHDVPALLQAIAEGVPVVAIDWADERLQTDTVVLHNQAAGAAAARFLHDHGHRRIALIGGDQTISTMRGRAQGLLTELAVRQTHAEPALLTYGPLTHDQGATAMRHLLALPVRPSAVFCTNAELTIGALTALHQSGLRLGTDLSLVGFDAAVLAHALKPALTTIIQPTREIAHRAADLVRARLTGDPAADHRKIVLHGRLHQGASVTACYD